MKRSRFKRAVVGLSVLVVVLATTAVTAPAANAVTGDKTSGLCHDANYPGSECQMYTNKCTKGSTFWLDVWEELGTGYQQWIAVGPHCTARFRHLMISGSNGVWTSWRTKTNSSSSYGSPTTLDAPFEAKKWCYSEWEVKRSDGTWWLLFYYNPNFLKSTTMQEICTDA